MPVTVTLAPCPGAVNAPLWMAVQDGDGGWSQILPSAGVFTFTLKAGKGAVAQLLSQESTTTLRVAYATSAEFLAMAPTCPGAAISVQGSATPLSDGDFISIRFGSAGTLLYAPSDQPVPFTLSNVQPGVLDLVAIKSRFDSTQTSEFATSVIIRRALSASLAASGGSMLALLDFTSASETIVPDQQTLAVTNAASADEVDVEAHFITPSTSAGLSGAGTGPVVADALTVPISVLPAARLIAGEQQEAELFAFKQAASTVSDGRVVTALITDAAGQSIALGPALGPVTVASQVRGTVSRVTAKHTVQDSYDGSWTFSVSQGQPDGSTRVVEVSETRGYQGAGTGVTLGVPDLSGVPGFSTRWLIASGVLAGWTFTATNSTQFNPFTGAVAVGLVMQSASRTQSIFAP